MSKIRSIMQLYKDTPEIKDNNLKVEENSLTALIGEVKSKAGETFDKLAYLAGIKNALLSESYEQLDKTNLSSLLSSAKNKGFELTVMSV